MEFTSFDEFASAYYASKDQPLFLRWVKAKTTSESYRSLLRQLLQWLP